MKKPILRIIVAIVIAAQVCMVAGLVVAFDEIPKIKAVFHSLFGDNSNINPDTDLVVIEDIWGRKGYMDNKGNVVIWPRYQYARDFSEGLASVGSGTKEGYINKNGQYQIKPQYDMADSFTNGKAKVDLGGKECFIDKSGSYLLATDFPYINELPDGYYEYCTKESGTEENSYIIHGILDKQGRVLYLPEFLYIYPARDGMIRYIKQDFTCGYFDTNYKTVFDDKYATGRDFCDGFAAVQDAKTRLWGFIDKSGNVVISFQYKYIDEFSEGLAAVQDASNLWGFINTQCKLVIPCRYATNLMPETSDWNWNPEGYMCFNGGLACIPSGDNRAFLINQKGETVVESFEMYDMIKNDYFEISEDLPEMIPDIAEQYGYSGLGLHWIEKTPGLLTFFDSTGKIKFTAKGEVAGSFINGLCSVGIGQGLQGKFTDKEMYASIDEWGNVLSDYQSISMSRFHNGIASFYTSRFCSGSSGYIDTSGHILWLPGEVKSLAIKVAIWALVAQLVLAWFIIQNNRTRHLSTDNEKSSILDSLLDANNLPPRRLVRAAVRAYPRQTVKRP